MTDQASRPSLPELLGTEEEYGFWDYHCTAYAGARGDLWLAPSSDKLASPRDKAIASAFTLADHRKWVCQYSYGKLFPVRSIFTTEDGERFEDLDNAIAHNAEVDVRARHRGLMPTVTDEFEVAPGEWVSSGSEDFNLVMAQCVEACRVRAVAAHNAKRLAGVYEPGMDLTELVFAMAKKHLVINPPPVMPMI